MKRYSELYSDSVAGSVQPLLLSPNIAYPSSVVGVEDRTPAPIQAVSGHSLYANWTWDPSDYQLLRSGLTYLFWPETLF